VDVLSRCREYGAGVGKNYRGFAAKAFGVGHGTQLLRLAAALLRLYYATVRAWAQAQAIFLAGLVAWTYESRFAHFGQGLSP
jgi:hypothetical protein